MLYPPIKKLMESVDSRYTLVIATAKRAREIAQMQTTDLTDSYKLVKCASNKPVTIAINEIAQGKIKFVRTEKAPKRKNENEFIDINE